MAVPIFLKVARAVRRTIGLAVSLRNGRQAANDGPGPAAPADPAGEPGADPAPEESEEEPVLGDIASTLAETLDAFDEYYRFLEVPVAEAVALIFETLGVPVETGRGPAEDAADPDPVPPAAAPTGEGAAFGSDRERLQARLDCLLSRRPGIRNRGPP